MPKFTSSGSASSRSKSKQRCSPTENKKQWVPVERSRQGPVDESPTTAVGEAAVAADDGGAASAVVQAAVAADDGGAAAAVAADGVGLPAELNAQHVPDGSGDTPCPLGNQDGDDDSKSTASAGSRGTVQTVTTFFDGDSVVDAALGGDVAEDTPEKEKRSTRQPKDITPEQQRVQAR